MTIARHKTETSFFLNICVSMEQFCLMQIYNNFISPYRKQKRTSYLDPDTISESEMLDEHRPFFVNSEFKMCHHSCTYRLFDCILNINGISKDYKQFTPNNVRHAYATLCEKTYGRGSDQSKQLANYMSHAYRTAAKHYVHRDLSDVTKRGEIAEGLRNVSSKSSRFHEGKNPYTQADPEKRIQMTMELNETIDSICEKVWHPFTEKKDNKQ